MMRQKRIARELSDLKKNPPWGISCDFIETDDPNRLEAKVVGPRDSPYEDGTFTLYIDVPERYPYEPPQIKFATPIYHPNIDKGGRICLDLIKMPPNGTWKPIVSIQSVLLTIQSLLATPNPDDPLMIDIANEYKCNRELYNNNAKEFTSKYAK